MAYTPNHQTEILININRSSFQGFKLTIFGTYDQIIRGKECHAEVTKMTALTGSQEVGISTTSITVDCDTW